MRWRSRDSGPGVAFTVFLAYLVHGFVRWALMREVVVYKYSTMRGHHTDTDEGLWDDGCELFVTCGDVGNPRERHCFCATGHRSGSHARLVLRFSRSLGYTVRAHPFLSISLRNLLRRIFTSDRSHVSNPALPAPDQIPSSLRASEPPHHSIRNAQWLHKPRKPGRRSTPNVGSARGMGACQCRTTCRRWFHFMSLSLSSTRLSGGFPGGGLRQFFRTSTTPLSVQRSLMRRARYGCACGCGWTGRRCWLSVDKLRWRV